MSIDNFTTSLIEMAEAVKAKPELEAQIAALKAELNICHDTININSLRIANLETELAEAKAKREEAIRERDDACFRNLELDEKLDQFASMAGKVLGLVRPSPAPVPTPEPVAEPIPAMIASYDPIPSDVPTEPAEYDWRTEAANAEPVALPAWESEEWAFGGGRPGNPPATGTDPLSW